MVHGKSLNSNSLQFPFWLLQSQSRFLPSPYLSVWSAARLLLFLQSRYRLHSSGSLDLSQCFVPSPPWTTRSDLSLSETSSLLRSDTHCTELRRSLGLAYRHTPAGHYLTHSPIRPRSATTTPSPTAGSTPMPLRSYLCTRPTSPFNHHLKVPTAPASSGCHPEVSSCLV